MISQSGKFSSITYDYRNLPTHFTTTTGSDISALYAAGGFRVFKESTNGDWQFYLRDGTLTLAAIDQNGFSHFNLTGNGISGRFEPSSNSRRYYIKDHLGSTRAVVNNSGSLIATFDYYPFGLLMAGRYTMNNSTIEKFTGKELDGSLGLYYFGARYYDAALGRWHNPDPLAQKHPEWSPYNYALNNPLYYVDPDGRQIEFFKGAWKGFSNTVAGAAKGTWQMVTHPADAVRSMSYAVTHPAQTYNMVKGGVAKRWDMVTSGDPNQVGQVFGEAAGTALMVVAGAKGAAKLAKGAKALAKVNKGSNAIPNANRLNHIFGNVDHNLGGLVSKFGSQGKAFSAVQSAANKALEKGILTPNDQGILPKVGKVLNVGGIKVRLIGGRVKNGKVTISSFSRKDIEDL